MEILKDITPDDFMVTADYKKVGDSNQNMLSLELKEKPENINNAVLRTKEIEFILKKE
ncbi:hypothetical protein NYZ99_09365 [Maribacter litopenaei]|uniref:Uncharacterized protein n=1 Tax=Maribacter litopenaei TaxID=2976127 RepID=A0ABY5YDW0_9FLAO|nr:hypothetical protein [Maribacter litopenaei]UWX56384.1 hypothetical protein NYZ99_09365 [Maribacter litopenaei]